MVEHIDVRRDGARLAEGGFWVVVASFEGSVDAWRCAEVVRDTKTGDDAGAGERHPSDDAVALWPAPDRWSSSMDRDEYMAGVDRIRAFIRDGDVYQVNLCRILTAPMPAGPGGPAGEVLASRLALGNPAPHAARIQIPAVGDGDPVWIVSASPESYLDISSDVVTSSPIKGTAALGESLLDKDEAENVMITDLVRNDLSHTAVPGEVTVPEFLATHEHPGLVHLQSTVRAVLAPEYAWTDAMWPMLLDGTFPPGSVSGAPKSSALEIISALETAPRGPYCGAIGWVDADRRDARLAVGIRTFWWTPDQGGALHFGTGAGITWGSDPAAEWRETELKASRLIGLASGGTMPS